MRTSRQSLSTQFEGYDGHALVEKGGGSERFGISSSSFTTRFVNQCFAWRPGTALGRGLFLVQLCHVTLKKVAAPPVSTAALGITTSHMICTGLKDSTTV